MSDKMREEFEDSVLSEYPNQNMGRFATGDYQSTTIEHCWWAWQASRKALVIDLSDMSNCFSPDDCGDWAMWLDDVKKLIEDAGLKVKP
ncbi:hypothetical protein [Pseudomonas agarici]|uniref:hypothetical protein n=2 Tax=Pseudomonas agarici TaxID=46677 RepID=UPI00030F364C|nr:hypothetical protein [Pseudomonas agarici]